ncbi:hypothetical protein QDG88_18185 [Pseudoalteromonas piscicida]|uniref:hypothetical protein n=1 Tax=Pseudoalteromonas piscicida TaxID=43662 RepID=UPI00273A0D88|nr:hypothetical protein [Pseudoalteromonas piscicida]MDP4489842.1 hypothetical protein [Pseudoalteromonas piscicida]
MEDSKLTHQEDSANQDKQKASKNNSIGKRAKCINWITENTVLTLFLVTGFYGFCLLSFGVVNGVYLADWNGLYTDLGITISEDGYITSFYASAEQDYWFFVFIGIMAWFISFVSSKKEAKNDKLITKINHFFPEVDPSSAHMRFLEQKINELSCIADTVTRKIIITSVDDGLIDTLVTVTTKLLNIHHNHDLTENFGEFYATPDDAVKNKEVWGRLNVFQLDTPSRGSEEVVKPQNFPKGEAFESRYNIDLNREEVGTLTINYSVWIDIQEKLETTPAFYTREYCLEVVNNTEASFEVEVTCSRHEDSKIPLKPNQSMDTALIFKDIKPDDDEIVIKFKKES